MKILRQFVQAALLTVLAVLFGLNAALAQKEVKGTVTDVINQPLQGVTVQLKGTGKATGTDQQGRFSIAASDNATLVFSFVGFSPKEVAVGTNQTLMFSCNKMLMP
jgi:hypothetical protein